MLCPKCKQNISDESIYCKYCGYEIRKPLTSSTSENTGNYVTPKRIGSSGLIVGIVVAVFCIIAAVVVIYMQKPKYKCDGCGKIVGTAYYDPFAKGTALCEDCAREYFAPFDYSAYIISDTYLQKHPEIPTY